MSLNEEQIDAFTIAVEQELTDDEFVGSDYTSLITDALKDLDTASQQEEYIKIAADLAILLSGGVVKSNEEREQRERDRIRLEEEQAEARRIARRQEREAREANITRMYSSPTLNPDTPLCGVPDCTLCPPNADVIYSDPTPRTAQSTQRSAQRARYYEPSLYGRGQSWLSPTYYTRAIDNTDPGQPLPEWERALLDGDPSEQEPEVIKLEGDLVEGLTSQSDWATAASGKDILRFIKEMKANIRTTYRL